MYLLSWGAFLKTKNENETEEKRFKEKCHNQTKCVMMCIAALIVLMHTSFLKLRPSRNALIPFPRACAHSFATHIHLLFRTLNEHVYILSVYLPLRVYNVHIYINEIIIIIIFCSQRQWWHLIGRRFLLVYTECDFALHASLLHTNRCRRNHFRQLNQSFPGEYNLYWFLNVIVVGDVDFGNDVNVNLHINILSDIYLDIYLYICFVFLIFSGFMTANTSNHFSTDDDLSK